MSSENKPSPLKNWRVWVAVVVVPIIGFAAWRGGLTVYEAFLKWRSERLAQEASEFFMEGKPIEARQSTEKSLDCNPANPDALRLLAKLQMASGQDWEAMETYKKLSATRAFTAMDAQSYARLAGHLKEWEIAERLIKALRVGPKSVETPLLESELAVLRGDIPRAEACLREAANLDSTAKSRALLAEFLIKHRLDLQTAPEVYSLLEQTQSLQTPVGAQMLAAALQDNLVSPVDVPKWIQQLRTHPSRTASMLLAADTAEVRYDPATKSRVASELFSRLPGAPFEDRKAAFFWLLANGEPALAADLIQQSEAVQDAVLFNAWLDALARTNRPAAVLQALGTPGNPLKDWRKALQAGRALRLSARSAEAATAYRQALVQAQAEPSSALEAVAFFGQAGEKEFFEMGLSQLLLDPAQNAQTLRRLMPIVRAWRHTGGLRRFCEFLAAAPGLSNEQRLQLENEIAYCDLVLGRKVDATSIQSLSASHPGDMPFQTTGALALLRQGKSEQAVEELVITQAPPDDPFLRARHKAVQAMALAANGDRQAAEKHFASLTEEFLSPEESALVRSFLKKTPR